MSSDEQQQQIGGNDALLDEEDAMLLLQNAEDAAEQQPQQQEGEEGTAQQQQEATAAALFVWVQTQIASEEEQGASAEPQLTWLPAVYCGQSEDGNHLVAFVNDVNQIFAVDNVEAIEDMSDARFENQTALTQYYELYAMYYGGAAEENDKEAAKRQKKEQKRLEKEQKRAEKNAKKEAKKAAKKKRRGSEDAAGDSGSESEDSKDDEESDDEEVNMDGGVDRMRRGGDRSGGNAAFGAVSAAPRTALDFATAGSSNDMRSYLAKARDKYEEVRNAALERDERMVEFESDYLSRIKQTRIDQLAVLRFLKTRVGNKAVLQAHDKESGWNFVDDLEKGNLDATMPPQTCRVEKPERFDRVPRAANSSNNGDGMTMMVGGGATQYSDPLLRQVSPPRFEVERRPLGLRTFTETSSGSSGSTTNLNKDFYVPMKMWHAKRDHVNQTPVDIVQVPPPNHVPRLFNEPKKKLANQADRITRRILHDQDAVNTVIDNRQSNTQFTLFDYVGKKFFHRVPDHFQFLEQQRHQDGLPSVGPTPAHLGQKTPNYSEVYNGGGSGGMMMGGGGTTTSGRASAVPSAAASEYGASQIPVYEDDQLGFHVDPQSKSMSRARSQQSQQSAISNDTSLGGDGGEESQQQQQQQRRNGGGGGSQPRADSQPQQPNQQLNNQMTWKKCAAKIISRVLTPYLHGTHGCPMLITDEDDFTALSRELTTKAYNSKLKMLGLAPELKHAPIPESEFSEQDAAMLAAAVQNYMKGRRRRGRSDSGSQQGSNAGSGNSSGTGTSYTGPGGSSVGSQGSGSRSFYSSSSASSYTSGAGSRSDYTNSQGGLTPYSTASQPEGGNRGYQQQQQQPRQ